MRLSRTIAPACWTMSILISTAAVVRTRRASHLSVARGIATASAPHPHAPPPAVAREADIAAIVQGNLLAPDRRPPEASSAAASAPIATAARPARPILTLRGIVGGPPWSIVIDGVPGRESGLVLRAGTPAAGLAIAAVRRDTVIVRGLDTTWHLTLPPR